ncbi:NADH pyrophosphatase [Novosphingobium marinum]|uniref:NAD(+) diphosphatase n=1 Tax=Novosphingobium marinum TaxID=1514948 RepID=A0A7Z0BUG8_9SPHN|nr:NAD(+) diphosphatase [Novosphingobium marinum]NYH95193.1 NAD+ diphosphatase [Novosphingobium marinum]GGC25049.1 NADH pyrophosphatase [Novosphingobium marinum]
MNVSIAFAGSRIDRADHVRADPERLSGLINPRARLLRMNGLSPVVSTEGSLEWGTLAEAADDADLVFLGLDGECACFAQVPTSLGGDPGPASREMRSAMAMLGESDLATFGGARSLCDWHARHRFCARCGSETKIGKGGWQRTCVSESCGAQHFPRVDPVTIMLVEHEGRVLLGRQPRFPKGFYSALAGFVEPGESLEEAVMRETLEEAGVRVRDVEYVASQPWPFPSSLMIGCFAHADDPGIVVDETELEDARWFERADVVEALEAEERGGPGRAFTAPPAYAIAHLLMKSWVGRG